MTSRFGNVEVIYKEGVLEEDGYDIFEVYSLMDIIRYLDLEPVKTILLGELELVGIDNQRDIIKDINRGDTLEVIKWDYEFENYIVIGYWEEDEMGYSFKFVGNRFEDLDYDDLMELIEEGQKVLNKKYKKTFENNINHIEDLGGVK